MLTNESKQILVSNLMYKIKDHLRKLPKDIREVEVTHDWIYETMEINNWSCSIMKVQFPIIPKGRISRAQYKELGINKLKMASVDRKDSSKGYTKDNTQIVCRFLNLGKTDNPNEDVIELLNEFKHN